LLFHVNAELRSNRATDKTEYDPERGLWLEASFFFGFWIFERGFPLYGGAVINTYM
jgi:hypothetical protein